MVLSLLSLVGEDFEIDEFIEVVEVADGLRLTDRTNYSNRGITWVGVTLEFDSVEQLAKLGTEEDSFPFIGEISVITDDDGNLSFERNLNLHDDEAQEMAFMFANTYWEFSIQFPGKVLYANTVDQNIDDETNTVTWIFSLASLMQKPQQMKATIVPPSNVGFEAYLLIIAIFLLVVVYVVIKRKTASAGN